MTSHLFALLQSLGIYLILAISFLGWGQAFVRLLGLKGQSALFHVRSIWLGWAVTLWIFQVLHLFFSITAYVVVPVIILGIFFSRNEIVKVFNLWPLHRLLQLRFLGIAFIGFLLTAWIASRAMLPPDHFDSGLYHLNAIRWINSYPIVPGLGNLHARFAYNQSFFVYAAALNFSPFFNHGWSIANSFLFLLTFATMLAHLCPVFQQPAALILSHPFKFLPALFALPFLIYLALTSQDLTSPSPDLASVLLQIVLFVMLADGLAEWLEEQHDQDAMMAALILLATTSITIKLSNLVFGATILFFALAYIVRTSQQRARRITRMVLPAAAILCVWCLRGIILSGAPLFPSTIGYMHLEWAVPKETFIDHSNWIYSWARQPQVHWSQVLGSWDWVGSWTQRNFTDPTRILKVVYPVVASVLFMMAFVYFSFRRKANPPRLLEWSILVPLFSAIVFWFFTAPEPRFANALLFLFMIGTGILFLLSFHKKVSRQIFIILLTATLIATNLHTPVALIYIGLFKPTLISIVGYQPIPVPLLEKKVTQSGLVVYTPLTGSQCWDAPLPCTPHFNETLRLRREGDLGSGFVVTKPYFIQLSPGNE